MAEISYRRHRFPPVIIQHAVWLYLRFTLSYRDVEEVLAERGLDISYETIRCWVLKLSAAEQSLAPRRDGGSDRRRADVSVACRRSRGRGPRYAGPSLARHSGGAAADAQAAQEAGICTQIPGHRQASLLRLCIPADESTKCSGSNPLAPPSGFSACMPASTTPSVFT